MRRMTSAFCCASLKTGTLVIGWVNLVFVLVMLAIGSTVLEVMDQFIHSQRASMSQQDMDTYKAMTLVVSVVVYGALALCILINISLLYGANKGRRAFMLPYMIFGGIGIGLSTLNVLFDIYYGVPRVKTMALRIVSIPISVYFLCIVWSFYIDLHPANQAAQNQSTVTVQFPVNQATYVVQPTTQYIPVQKQDPFNGASEKEFSQMA